MGGDGKREETETNERKGKEKEKDRDKSFLTLHLFYPHLSSSPPGH